jgi:hypothetical protein
MFSNGATGIGLITGEGAVGIQVNDPDLYAKTGISLLPTVTIQSSDGIKTHLYREPKPKETVDYPNAGVSIKGIGSTIILPPTAGYTSVGAQYVSPYDAPKGMEKKFARVTHGVDFVDHVRLDDDATVDLTFIHPQTG